MSAASEDLALARQIADKARAKSNIEAAAPDMYGALKSVCLMMATDPKTKSKRPTVGAVLTRYSRHR